MSSQNSSKSMVPDPSSSISWIIWSSLTLLSTTLWLYIPTPSSTERGRLRLSPSLTPSDRLTEVPSLMLTTDTVCPRLLGSPTLLCIPSPPLSITVLSDIPTPWSTARGRLRPSPSTDTDTPLTHTTVLSTTVLSDIPDIIPMSTARGRLRPSPSTDTDTPLTLTFTRLVSWLPLVSDTLSP